MHLRPSGLQVDSEAKLKSYLLSASLGVLKEECPALSCAECSTAGEATDSSNATGNASMISVSTSVKTTVSFIKPTGLNPFFESLNLFIYLRFFVSAASLPDVPPVVMATGAG